MIPSHTSVKLDFVKTHKSISSLKDVELPELAIITGENGTGKSHLLEAIENKSIKSLTSGNVVQHVVRHTAVSISPKDTGNYVPLNQASQTSSRFAHFALKREEALQKNSQLVIIENIKIGSLMDGSKASNDAIQALLGHRVNDDKAKQAARNALRDLNSDFRNENDRFDQTIQSVRLKDPFFLLYCTESEFLKSDYYLKLEVKPFEQKFAILFTQYRSLLRENFVNFGLREKEGISNAEYLEDDEFQEKYGPKPWEFVNTVLEDANLGFQINKPDLGSDGSYHPKLIKKDSSIEIPFLDLSSGEKVIIAFALLLYNFEDARQNLERPELMLFDEIDSPLHPSMVVYLLNVIKNTIIKKMGIPVILTTHSPTTVALADDEALFLMQATEPRLIKTDKQHALDVLTIGVPTMSISFEDRRQIYVEAEIDARIYEALYNIYRDQLNASNSPVFINAGRRKYDDDGKKASNIGGGHAAVTDHVAKLRNAGVATVMGVIDWDGSNLGQKDCGIHVFCENQRYTLENFIFDPVLLIVKIIRDDREKSQEVGLNPQGCAATKLREWKQEDWQNAVDLLQGWVFDNPCLESIPIKYLNGMILEVRKDYLQMNGHVLEKILRKKLEHLGLKRDKLSIYLVSKVLPEYDQLFPEYILDFFSELLALRVPLREQVHQAEIVAAAN
ncbi:AAA family ATPase [Pseudovibrio denitrificans]|uniref:AAA family ATPase n=1 Tax=Pseudovibrio denitrificans TaxID=258256 RepID=UPI0039BF3716